MISSALVLLFSAAPSLELRASVDGRTVEPGWAYVRAEQQVVLKAALQGSQAQTVRWFKVEPAMLALDNTTPAFHFEPVAYQETPLPGCDDRLECPADLTPTILPKVAALPGVGTMAFKVRVTTKEGVTVETPGREATQWGGLTREVFRVVARRDDSLLGYASELVNTPYIFGSAGPDGRNQSDLLIGSDCADLIVYGRRRAGKKAEYTSSYALDRQALPLPKGTPIQAGDVVHFPSTRHVALVFEDRPPLGVIDSSDLILHTCWAPPTVQPISETRCGSEPMRMLRFPR